MGRRRDIYVNRRILEGLGILLPMAILLCVTLGMGILREEADERFNILWAFRTLFFFYGTMMSCMIGMNAATYSFSRFVSYGATRKEAANITQKIQIVPVAILVVFTILFDLMCPLYGSDFAADVLLIITYGLLFLVISLGCSILAIRKEKAGYILSLPIILFIGIMTMILCMFFRYDATEIVGRYKVFFIASAMLFAIMASLLKNRECILLGKEDVRKWFG